MQILFDAELWLWVARRTATWTFVSLRPGESEEIRDLAGGLRRGFGSLRVLATIREQHLADVDLPGQRDRIRASGQAVDPFGRVA